MKIALISMEIIPGRPDLNAVAMAERIREAKDAHAELALFPALSLSGLFLGSVWKQPSFVRDCTAYAEEIAAAADGITVIFGNVAAGGEGCCGLSRTLLHARDGVLREVARRPLHGAGTRFSPLLYELPGEHVILAADASPFPLCFEARTLAKTAQEQRAVLLYVNTLGLQDKGKTVYTFAGSAQAFRADGARALITPAYKDGVTIVDTAVLPAPADRPSPYIP